MRRLVFSLPGVTPIPASQSCGFLPANSASGLRWILRLSKPDLLVPSFTTGEPGAVVKDGRVHIPTPVFLLVQRPIRCQSTSDMQ